MESFPYADIIILALIAGFILLRLRSVLGQKNGTEDNPFFKRDVAPRDNESVVQLSERTPKNKPANDADTYLLGLNDQAIAATIADIKKIDSQFNATGFLQGARMAYEMVFDAFAKGDKKTLEMLLDKPIYDTFAREIDAQQQTAKKIESTLVSIKARDIVQATLMGNKARLAVKFESEQVSLVKDADGKIIEGDASVSHLMDDEWVFERDVASKNPNWKIIET